MVCHLADPKSPAYSKAMAEFCQEYWYPLYAFVRREGRSPVDAEDAIQSFFVKIIEDNWLREAKKEKGRLRSYLIAFLKNHLRNLYKHAQAQKRGGGKVESLDALILDIPWAEGRYASEPVDDMTPDRLAQRCWALTMLEKSIKILEDEERAKGREERFRVLRSYLGFSATVLNDTYAETGRKLGIAEGTVKYEVSKLNKRWGLILKEQVALTLDSDDEDEIKAELGELILAL